MLKIMSGRMRAPPPTMLIRRVPCRHSEEAERSKGGQQVGCVASPDWLIGRKTDKAGVINGRQRETVSL